MSDRVANEEPSIAPMPLDAPAPAGANARKELSRRGFLGSIGMGTAALTAAGVLGPALAGSRASTVFAGVKSGGGGKEDCLLGPLSPKARQRKAYLLRINAAKAQLKITPATHDCNGDETLYSDASNFKLNSYSKGLPHDPNTGLVHPAAYSRLIHALSTGVPADFEAIPLTAVGSPLQRKLVNPQSGLAWEMQGSDSHVFDNPPAPAFTSKEAASEMLEMYWMALLRDVPFEDYPGHPLAVAAAADLNAFGADFKGPKVGGLVTEATLFRDTPPGCTVGPYLSQGWFNPIPFGAQYIEQKIQGSPAGQDFMKDTSNWLRIQDGLTPLEGYGPLPAPRFMNDGRCLAQWVHIDVLFQAYFQMCLVLGSIGAPLNPGNPYLSSLTQDAFGTWGGPWNKTLVAFASTNALKAVWFQKWYVHRRARPEYYAGMVEYALNHGKPYPIDPQLANSDAVSRLLTANGTAHLPMAFPEGSPLHPSYGAGHATVAGCGATILKYIFDGDAPWPVQAWQPSSDGQSLVPYTGPTLTVGGEINKIASNVGTGRNIAGMHWRTDAIESFRLGQAVAVSVLRDHKELYNENVGDISFTGFDGETITI